MLKYVTVHNGVEDTLTPHSLAVSLAAIVALVFAVVRKDGDTQTEEGLTLESVPYSSSTTGRQGFIVSRGR